ncbi:Hypothetical protein UVM_LOCUS169, partial [uncultured virus]
VRQNQAQKITGVLRIGQRALRRKSASAAMSVETVTVVATASERPGCRFRGPLWWVEAIPATGRRHAFASRRDADEYIVRQLIRLSKRAASAARFRITREERGLAVRHR